MKTRVMSVILAVLLILTLIPATAFAQESGEGDMGTPAPTESTDPTDSGDPDEGTPDPVKQLPKATPTPAPDVRLSSVSITLAADDLAAPSGLNKTLSVSVSGQGSVSGWVKVLGVFVPTSVMGSNSFLNGSEIRLQANPAAGWEFSEWGGNAVSGSSNPVTFTINGNKTVTAVFSELPKYTVTFRDWDGSVLKTQTVTKGGNATAPANPTRDGYRFTGWSVGYTNVQNNLDVYAEYVQQCTVTISKEGSGTIFPGLVAGVYDVGETIDLSKAVPIPALGWSFRGWRDNSTGSILGSSIVQLTGSSASFTAVFFDSEVLHVRAGANGTLGSNIGGVYERGEQVNLNDANPTGDPGYVFDKWMEYGLGWTGGGTERDAVITIGDSNWFEAKFKMAQYTISYNLNGGEASGNPASYTYFSPAFELNNPTKAGYIFNGWSGTGIADNTMTVTVPTHSSGNRQYTASWTPISYTVNYHANGGEGSMSPSTYVFDSAGALAANSFTKTGCAFIGWATSPDGDVVYADGAAVNNWATVSTEFNLYAKWEVSDIVVTGYNAPYDGAYHGVSVSGAADIATVTYSTDGINYGSASLQFKDVTAAGGVQVYVKVQIDGAEDYTGSARVEITKAPLVVKAVNKSVPYGSDAPNYTYNITGFVAGEKKNKVVTGEPVLECEYAPGDPADKYDIIITKGTLAAANYEFFCENGTLTVNKAQLTVTADSFNIYYGDSAPSPLTYKIEGFVLGETESVLNGTAPKITCTYVPGNTPADYVIKTARGTLAADNYKFKYVDGTLAVAKKPLTVTANNKLTVYGQAAPSFDVAYGSFALGQDASVLSGTLTIDCEYGVGSAAGSYDIVPGGLTSDNYDIAFVTGKLTVNPAALTVTADDKSATYGAAAPAFTVTYGGFVLDDDASALGGTLDYDCSYAPGSATGNYSIMPKGLSSGNYDITFAEGTLTVNPAALTVTADDKAATYGAAAPAFTVTIGGFVLDEDAAVLGGTLDYDCSYAPGSATGNYSIMPKGLSSGNYAITFAEGTLTVNPAALTVTADDKAVTYLDDPPAYTATYAGFVAGDDANDLGGALTFDCNYVRGSAAGGYTITPGGLTSGNYTIAFVPGTLTVDQLVLTVRFVDYDGALLGRDRVVYGRSADAPEDPEREGYNFTGWNRDFDVVRTSMTVTATYAIKTFTVTFADFDGTVLATDTVDWNTAATAPADPSRDGYTFTGWDADFSAVTANMTVTAQYSQNEVIENEPVPQTGGSSDDDTVILQDDGVPLQGPAFPWWWIVIGVGVAGLLFLLILFLVRRKKEEQSA